MDNWATCDCFKAKCIKDNKDDFLHVLERLFLNRGAFYQRYVLVTLLTYYAEEKYISVIEKYITLADTELYYVHMAVAWLIAEIITKRYEDGLLLLKNSQIDVKTYNKAIQKARESYRLTTTQKEFLNSLKK
jgi:3-methyladenine DNA glycosylase AlkD